MTYFHGGQAGLRVGDRILPQSETGASTGYDHIPDSGPTAEWAAEVYRRDRIYLTPNIELARWFAALHPSGTDLRGGDVYRVEPVGEVEDDPDWHGPVGAAVRCPSGVITGIAATGVRRGPYMRALIRDGAL